MLVKKFETQSVWQIEGRVKAGSYAKSHRNSWVVADSLEEAVAAYKSQYTNPRITKVFKVRGDKYNAFDLIVAKEGD